MDEPVAELAGGDDVPRDIDARIPQQLDHDAAAVGGPNPASGDPAEHRGERRLGPARADSVEVQRSGDGHPDHLHDVGVPLDERDERPELVAGEDRADDRAGGFAANSYMGELRSGEPADEAGERDGPEQRPAPAAQAERLRNPHRAGRGEEHEGIKRFYGRLVPSKSLL